MHRWISNVCKQHADRVLIRPSYQYKDLLKSSNEKQHAYRRQGVRPGSKVVLSEHNSIALLSKMHALWELAATPCLIPARTPNDKKRECQDILRRHDRHDVDTSERMGSVDALIMFTSGTSAQTPKAVRLSHTNLCRHIEMVSEHVPTEMLTPNDRTFSFLPWTHCYGLMGECFSVMDRGGSMGILSPECQLHFSFPRFYRDLQLTQPTILFVVPQLLETILQRDEQIRRFIPSSRLRRGLWFGKSLRFIVSGGGPLRPHVRRAFWEHLEIPILQGYGCTEMSPMIALQTEFNVDDLSVGKVLPHVDIKFKDNEVLVNGPTRFVGYIQEAPLPHFAFHNTRDRGYLQEDGSLVLTGRTSDVIKLSNGRFVNIQDLESTMKEMVPYARDACLWQVPSSGQFFGVVHVDQQQPSTPRRRRVRIFSETVDIICVTEPFKKIGDGTMTLKHEMCRPAIQKLFERYFIDPSTT